jgi:hypothetical protein
VEPDEKCILPSSALDPRGELEPAKIPVVAQAGPDPGLVGSGESHDASLKIAGRVIVVDFFIS